MTQLNHALDRPTVPTHTPHLRSHIKAAAEHLQNDSEEMRQCSPE
jgi:hypothetical protein